MKLFKKVLCLFALVLFVFAAVGCNLGNSGDNKDDEDKKQGEEFKDTEFKISYDTQGGSAIAESTIKLSEIASFNLPANPTKEGKEFAGWYLDANCTKLFALSELANIKDKEIKLYAKWVDKGQGGNVLNGVSFKAEYNTNASFVDREPEYTYDFDSETGMLAQVMTGIAEDKYEVTGKITVEGNVGANEIASLRDLSFTLKLTVYVNAQENNKEAFATNFAFELYVNNGVVYALLPAELTGEDAPMGVSLDVAKIIEDNTPAVEAILKEFGAAFKEEILPMISQYEEFIPEDFDLSVLDTINWDNLTFEELLKLTALLPVIPEETDPFDYVIGMAEEELLPLLEEAGIDPEFYAQAKGIVLEILEILAQILPAQTKNGNVVKFEVTQAQYNKVINDLSAYIEENAEEIVSLVAALLVENKQPVEKVIDLEETKSYEDYEGKYEAYLWQPYFIKDGVKTHFKDTINEEYSNYGYINGDLFQPFVNYDVVYDMADDWEMYQVLAYETFYYNDYENYLSVFLVKGNKFYAVSSDSESTELNGWLTLQELYDASLEDGVSFCFNEYKGLFEFGYSGIYFDFGTLDIGDPDKFDIEGVCEAVELYLPAVKAALLKAVKINDAKVEITLANEMPTKIEAAIDVEFKLEGADLEFLDAPEEASIEAKYNETAKFEVLGVSTFELPSFASYMDLTAMLQEEINGLFGEYFPTR